MGATDGDGTASRCAMMTDIIFAIASMHDRAARRSKDPVRRLVHEESAIHLRSIADDPEIIAALIERINRAEASRGDI